MTRVGWASSGLFEFLLEFFHFGVEFLDDSLGEVGPLGELILDLLMDL